MNYWYKLKVSVLKALGRAASYKKISLLVVCVYVHACIYACVCVCVWGVYLLSRLSCSRFFGEKIAGVRKVCSLVLYYRTLSLYFLHIFAVPRLRSLWIVTNLSFI